MNNVCWSPIMWYLELGELCRARITTGVRSGMRHEAVVVTTSFMDRMVMERLDQLIGVNVSCERHFVLWCFLDELKEGALR